MELARKRTLGEFVPLNARVAVSDSAVPFSERTRLEFNPISEGERWGSAWQSGWFHFDAVVPETWNGRHVVARVNVGGEALVFQEDGCPLVGLTSNSVYDLAYEKDVHHLISQAEGREHIELIVEGAAYELWGVHRIGDPEFMEQPSRLHGHYQGELRTARLQCFDDDHWHLCIDLDVALDLYDALPDSSRRKQTLLRGLNEAATAYDLGGPEAARARLATLIDMDVDPAEIRITAVGHAHIDTAWLWPVREAVRKSARTFASALKLMDEYPDYTFGASQPAHYHMVKEQYPQLYARIRDSVAQGRWEIQGGMWVEADCNLISGESMIRQFLHGKGFFMDEFGMEVRNLWLPDVFGYSAQLPQIMLKCGCPTFLTQKLSWGKYTDFPHHTFNWKGIDGSAVVAHFPPEDTYNSKPCPSQARRGADRYKDADVCNEALCLFGVGDGGGGPAAEHIERARRMKNLNGIPALTMGPAQPVLDRMLETRDGLATWTGELYLEYHRGTFTTQAQTKRLNRRMEEALRACEEVCSRGPIEAYPAKALDDLWKKTLLNQFHDIIPGSSIHQVYEECEAELASGIATCEALVRQSLGAREALDAVALVNPNSTTFDDLVPLPAHWTGSVQDGEVLPVQLVEDQHFARVKLGAGESAILSPGTEHAPSASGSDLVLENDRVCYTFDENLRLIDARDKECDQPLLATGAAGNVLSLYEDRPHRFDAWDIDEYYLDSRLDEARTTGDVEKLSGPCFCQLKASLGVGASAITQCIRLREDSKRLDFVTTVQWNESHHMLRVAFPTCLDLDTASYEIQYGVVERTCRANSVEDSAKFEVCGHRYADLSRGDWGIALLNDSKYGYRIFDGVMDLNLLRSPTDPDPIADKGEQRFTYSLLPHGHHLSLSSEVRAEAAMLNQGLTIVPGIDAVPTAPARLSGEGLELGAVKKAEREDAWVVRICEPRGIPATGALLAPGYAIREADMLERPLEAGRSGEDGLDLRLTAFEISTFLLRPRSAE